MGRSFAAHALVLARRSEHSEQLLRQFADDRWAEGRYDQLPAWASELIRLEVIVIAAIGGTANEEWVNRKLNCITPIGRAVL